MPLGRIRCGVHKWGCQLTGVDYSWHVILLYRPSCEIRTILYQSIREQPLSKAARLHNPGTIFSWITMNGWSMNIFAHLNLLWDNWDQEVCDCRNKHADCSKIQNDKTSRTGSINRLFLLNFVQQFLLTNKRFFVTHSRICIKSHGNKIWI